MTTEKNTYQPLGEQAWLSQLQKGAGMRTQRGCGFGSLLRSAIPVVKQHIVQQKSKRKKKRLQKGSGFAVRPLKRIQRALGPIRVRKTAATKSIKRKATTKKRKRKITTVGRKKKKSSKKRSKKFQLF